MKVVVIGAGRVDVVAPSVSPKIMDPFLVLTRSLCDHFDEVSVEVNTPRQSLGNHVTPEVLGRLRIGYQTHYSSFLDYFTKLRNFTPTKLSQLSWTIRAADVVLLRIPGPVVFVAAFLCRLHGKPYLTYVASDLHQIGINFAGAPSLVSRIKGRATKILAAIFRSQVISGASRRLYNSEKIQADYLDSASDNSALLVTSLVERVHSFKPTNVGQGIVRLIFVGRLVAEKGLKELTNICNELAQSGLEVHMDIVGDGREADTLAARFTNLGHPNLHLTLHGWVSDREYLDRLMVAADFCLLPSHNEGTPKVIYEAWASSTIFVGTSVGGIPSAVRDGIDGLLFRVGDSRGAVAKIKAMIDDPAQIDRMNQITAGQVDNFTLQATAKRLAGEIENCLE